MSYMNYDHVKPDDLQRRGGAENDSESSEQEEAGLYAGEKKVHEFDSEKHFTKA